MVAERSLRQLFIKCVKGYIRVINKVNGESVGITVNLQIGKQQTRFDC